MDGSAGPFVFSIQNADCAEQEAAGQFSSARAKFPVKMMARQPARSTVNKPIEISIIRIFRSHPAGLVDFPAVGEVSRARTFLGLRESTRVCEPLGTRR